MTARLVTLAIVGSVVFGCDSPPEADSTDNGTAYLAPSCEESRKITVASLAANPYCINEEAFKANALEARQRLLTISESDAPNLTIALNELATLDSAPNGNSTSCIKAVECACSNFACQNLADMWECDGCPMTEPGSLPPTYLILDMTRTFHCCSGSIGSCAGVSCSVDVDDDDGVVPVER